MELVAEKKVHKGFKLSEVGLIPKDWEVSTVGEKFVICNNLRYPISAIERKKKQGIYPYYGPTQIQDYLNEYRLEGQFALIGEDGDHFLKWDQMPMTQLTSGKFNVNNHAHIIKGASNFTLWFYYFFKHRDITEHLTRQGAGRYKLTKAALKKLACAIPPTDVERAEIISALTDAESLIHSLEKLIAKKRLIKQGAMQELLRPKEGWEVKKLGEVVEKITTGKLDANAMIPNGLYRFYTCAKEHYYINTFAFDDEALLVSGNGANVGYVHYYKGKFNAYQRTYVLTGFKINITFVKIYMDVYLRKRIASEVNAGNTPYIKMNTLTEMVVSFPKDVREQTRIATILSDMDAEIETLEKKLEKYRKIKQGMMQELLTGKTRLV